MTSKAWDDFVSGGGKFEADITCNTCGELKPATHYHWRLNHHYTKRVRRKTCRVCTALKKGQPGKVTRNR